MKKNIFLILMLFLAVLVCYGKVLDYGFIWDDQFLIEGNTLLRAPLLSFQVFKQDIVNSGFTHTMYYRPVQILSYALDQRVWGMNPLGFHLTSILIHFVNSALVFYLVLLLIKNKSAAFLTSFLFAVHPAFLGVVAYVSGRADLLMFMFGFLFILSNIYFRKNKNIIFAVAGSLFLLLSILSKEAGLIFVLLFLLVDRMILKEEYAFKAGYHFPGFAVSGMYLILHRIFIGDIGTLILPSGVVEFLSSTAVLLSRSIVTCVFPFSIHMRQQLSGGNMLFIPAGLIFLFIVLCVFIFKKDRSLLLFAMSFFAIAIIPFCLVASTFGVFAEHWVYIPSFGILMFLSVVLNRLIKDGKIFIKAAAMIVMLGFIISYATATVSQSVYWTDDLSLSNRVLSASSVDTAASHFKALSALDGTESKGNKSISDMQVRSPRELYLRGRLKMASGDTEGALLDFRKSVQLKPDYDNGYLGLSFVAFSLNKPKKGIEYLEKVLYLNPRHPEALFLLSMSYSKSGNDVKALEVAMMAERADPYGYDTLLNLGTAYTRNGYLKEGAETYLKVIKTYPEKPKAYYNLGQIFLVNGDTDEALLWAKKCLDADPSFAPALEMLEKLKK